MDLIYGIDIGDGETASSFLGFNKIDLTDKKFNIDFVNSRMTFFWKNKDGQISLKEEIDIDAEKLFCNFKRQPTTLSDNEFNAFSKIMIDYCNLYYENVILNHINQNSKAQEIRKIVFCIGHPTNWLNGDVQLYKKIFLNTKFGQDTICINNQEINCVLLLEPESRAAFLHYQNELNDFRKMKNRLLIDVGSSTIDLTAVSGKNNLSIYNSGHNYLGARIIDYVFREFILDKKIPEIAPDKLHIFKINELANQTLLLECRKAKEEFFDALKNKLTILTKIDDRNFDDKRIKVSLDDFLKILDLQIKNVIGKYQLCSEKDLKIVENQNWKYLFKKFLENEKSILDKKQFNIEEIIFSGSASLMSFIPDVCKDVFGETVSIQWDESPGIAISNGLVLCVVSNAKSNSFRNEINEVIRDETPLIIEKNLSFFSSIISSFISNYITDVTYNELLQWKQGKIITLNDVKDSVIEKCNSSVINTILNEDKSKEMIKNWYMTINSELYKELQQILSKYNVNLGINKNICYVPSFGLDVVVETIISDFYMSIIETAEKNVFCYGNSFFDFLLPFFLNPIVSILVFLGGILARLGKDKILTFNIPMIFRKGLSEKKLKEAAEKGREQVLNKINEIVSEDSFKKKIIECISKNIVSELNKTVKEIQYIIESRTVI